jgi:hemerythrin-like domain-containing protein
VKLTAELQAEHDLIERVLGSFRTFVDRLPDRGIEPADGARFVAFLREYAGAFHHGREEGTLFAALHEIAELPDDRGPIAVLRDDHHRIAALLDRIAPLLARACAGGAAEVAAVRPLVVEYTRALWHHIDAENSVLFPEGDARLAKHGVAELPVRPMTAAERAAQAAGEDLAQRYAPAADPGIVRGDGCVACQAFAVSCGGIEQEWWNEWEWDEMEDHLSNG